MQSEQLRRALATVVTIAALAIVVWGIFADDTAGDRVEALGRSLKCPVCTSESIADSPSQTARELRALIAEQVADGWTDDEVVDYFVARYGEQVRLDPPASGRNVALVALPAIGLGVGVAAIASLVTGSRKRRNVMESGADS